MVERHSESTLMEASPSGVLMNQESTVNNSDMLMSGTEISGSTYPTQMPTSQEKKTIQTSTELVHIAQSQNQTQLASPILMVVTPLSQDFLTTTSDTPLMVTDQRSSENEISHYVK